MSRVRTSVLLRGLPEAVASLDRVAAAADDISPVWPALGQLFAQRQDTVFASDGLGRWAPMTTATMRDHQSPLVDTGVMADGVAMAHPIWSVRRAASFGAEKRDRRVMNVAVLNSAGHRDRGGGWVPPRVVVPPLRAAERRAWVGVVRAHMGRAVR